MYNVISFLGLFILMGIAWALSTNRRVVNWRVIAWGLALQFVFAFFVFIVPAGQRFFEFVNRAVIKVLDCATAGTSFVFGPLADPGKHGFILAFQALPTIIFFASLVALLYYIGFMPLVIKLFARMFTKLMRISGAEALSTASNIFVGVESAVTIRPYLSRMTQSELCLVLVAGMGTIASSVMALYVMFLKPAFPAIAGHLVSASILSAPACIIMSKLIMPETDRPATLGMDVPAVYERESTALEAVINGANAGLKLVGGVIALLLAVLGIIALADLILSWTGARAGGLVGMQVSLSLKGILGVLFYPLTLVLGVPVADAWQISGLIGERTIATEVKSYMDLATLLSSNSLAHPHRSAVIAVYALCGFAHVASLAIFVGGTTALVPERTRDISRIGVRALIAATLACLMIACIAGIFYTEGAGTVLFGAGVNPR